MLEELLADYLDELIVHDDIIQTSDGNLFLGGGAHGAFAYKLGKLSVDPVSFDVFDKNIADRRAFLRRRNIRYVHAIAPDKETVLKVSLPERMKLGSLIDLYRGRCKADFLDLRPKEPIDGSYMRTDTHWALPFQTVAVLQIAKSLGIPADEIAEGQKHISVSGSVEVRFIGDLAGRMEPVISERALFFRPEWLKELSNKPSGWNDGAIHIFQNEAAPARRLLVFGDSFGRMICPLLSIFFDTVLFCRSRYFHPEMVEMMRPTHVMTQQVERFLDRVTSDKEASRFLLMPFINGSPVDAGPDFWRALNAILSPSPAGRREGLASRVLGGRF